MPSPAPDAQALARFRQFAAAALAAADRPAFDAALRALSSAASRPLPDLLAAPALAADPHLAALFALAADLRWLEPADPDRALPTLHAPALPQAATWAAVLKRAVTSVTDPLADPPALPAPSAAATQLQLPHPAPPSPAPHVFRPTHARAFVPLLPNRPPALPTAVLHADNGLLVTSFRRWKWDASSLPSSPCLPSSPRLAATSDTSSVASSTSAARPAETSPHATALANAPPLALPPPSGGAASAEFEAGLLAGMPHLSSARPAGAAAAAAFRALAPFLGAEERAALRQAFATLPPVDCLATVVRVAERASARRTPVALGLPAGGGVWSAAFASSWPGSAPCGDAFVGLGAPGGGVWGEGGAGWDAAFADGEQGNAAAASGLDANAPPFRMTRALTRGAERL